MDIVLKCLMIISVISCVPGHAWMPTSRQESEVAPPTKLVFNEGDNITIICNSNKTDYCEWMKNDEGILIWRHSRITYVEPESLLDYSITISKATSVDQGTWKCICESGWTPYVTNVTVLTLNANGDKKEIESDIFEKHPENVTLREGESFYLTCILKEAGSCLWSHNGGPGLYYFGNYDTKYVKTILAKEGRWKCICSLNSSPAITVESKEGWVTVTSTKIPEQNSFNVTIQAGQNIVVYCKHFNSEVCLWKHNNKDVYTFSHSRISYVNGDMSDWSIRIHNVEKEDQGQWECTCHLSDRFSTLKHNMTVITVLDDNAATSSEVIMLKHPESVIVNQGSSFTLNSTFNLPVSCFWIHLQSSRMFIVYGRLEQKERVCTLTIENAQLRDEGHWRVLGIGETLGSAYNDVTKHQYSDSVLVSVIPTLLVDSPTTEIMDQPSPPHTSSTESVSLVNSTSMPIQSQPMTHVAEGSFSTITVILIAVNIILALITTVVLIFLFKKRDRLFDKENVDSSGYQVKLLLKEEDEENVITS